MTAAGLATIEWPPAITLGISFLFPQLDSMLLFLIGFDGGADARRRAVLLPAVVKLSAEPPQ